MHENDNVDWNVTLVDTGEKTMTERRIKKLRKFIGNETYLITYGDGLSNINLDSLLKVSIKVMEN